jgi:hypothetical protein
MPIKIKEYTTVELSIIQALVGRKRKFSELKQETRFTTHWLALGLRGLRNRGIVRKSVNAKNDLLGWELEPKWLEQKQNGELTKSLGTLREWLGYAATKAETDPSIKDPGSKSLVKLIAPFIVQFSLACAMQFYRKDKLYKVIEERAKREVEHVLIEAFDPIKKMNTEQLLENTELFDIDLTKTTFEQFMKRLPTVEEIAERKASWKASLLD